MNELIGAIMAAAGDVVARVVGQCIAGDQAGAELTVRRFRALTRAELADDRAEAERIMRERLGNG